MDKPSEKEEQWVAEQELERRKAAQAQADERKLKEDAQKLKELHWMRCPKCGQELEEKRETDIVIDQCKSCGGIWLDQGELEALVKLSVDARTSFFGRLKGLIKSPS